MKIAVVGAMNPRQQLVIDKMIADGHEIVYIGKDASFGGIAPDLCIVDEYSEVLNSMFENIQFPVGAIQRSVWKVKLRSQKPYYRQKEKY